jgi:hypothetical protein
MTSLSACLCYTENRKALSFPSSFDSSDARQSLSIRAGTPAPSLHKWLANDFAAPKDTSR